MRVRIADFEVGGSEPLCLIAGPCVIESPENAFLIARRLKEICARLKMPLVFKASYDKANRTSAGSFRGPGIEAGLRVLEGVRRELGLPVLSDVHSPDEATRAGAVLDILQVPAFLCRQTDLLVAAGRAARVVNVKKGQFMAPGDVVHFRDKVGPGAGLLVTERGTSFGYHDLVVDFRALQEMRACAPVIFDATHAVQQPGLGAVSGGRREFVPLLARAAAAAGCAGLFLEVHPDPERALSDGPNMIALDALPSLLEQVSAIDRLVKQAWTPGS